MLQLLEYTQVLDSNIGKNFTGARKIFSDVWKYIVTSEAVEAYFHIISYYSLILWARSERWDLNTVSAVFRVSSIVRENEFETKGAT